jgi:NADPH:quinone reductase-like Zn-dependent oxidoreductase
MGIRGRFAYELMFTRSNLGIELEKQGQILNRVSTLLDQGVLTSTLTRTLPWSEMAAAHEAVETGHMMGKIGLKVGE